MSYASCGCVLDSSEIAALAIILNDGANCVQTIAWKCPACGAEENVATEDLYTWCSRMTAQLEAEE